MLSLEKIGIDYFIWCGKQNNNNKKQANKILELDL
jgi:hypothetical protein